MRLGLLAKPETPDLLGQPALKEIVLQGPLEKKEILVIQVQQVLLEKLAKALQDQLVHRVILDQQDLLVSKEYKDLLVQPDQPELTQQSPDLPGQPEMSDLLVQPEALVLLVQPALPESKVQLVSKDQPEKPETLERQDLKEV